MDIEDKPNLNPADNQNKERSGSNLPVKDSVKKRTIYNATAGPVDQVRAHKAKSSGNKQGKKRTYIEVEGAIGNGKNELDRQRIG